MELQVNFLDLVAGSKTLSEISEKMDMQERHAIAQVPWPNYPYKPSVDFSIAYSEDAILLKYYVIENAIRISFNESNSPVHKDSCVEFFIAFDGEENYYNLEFNPIGTCLMGYGKSRNNRKLIPAEVISGIRRLSVIRTTTEKLAKEIRWELTLIIPSEVFNWHKIGYLKHRQCRVNFYKCGDELAEPHFLSWKEVVAAEPDFHLPESFGVLYFS